MKRQKKITQYDYKNEEKQFENYIRESDFRLKTDESIIVHLDGVGFTRKYYKQLDAEKKKAVIKAIADSALKICSEISSVRIAYAFCDEVSFVLDGEDIQANEHNRMNKIMSKFTSMLTLYFYKTLKTLAIPETNDLAEHAVFSGKTYNLPSSYVEKYLKWRLLGCKKLIFDRKENFEAKEDWEKYGYIISKQAEWNYKNVDFENKKIKKLPQNQFLQLED